MCVGVNERGEDSLWEGLGLFVLDLWLVCIKANEQARCKRPNTGLQNLLTKTNG